MNESYLESKLKKYCNKYPAMFFMKLSPSNDKGIPDRIVLAKNKRICFIELKIGKGRLSELQKIKIEKLRKLDHDVHVISNFDDGKKIIDDINA